VICDATRVDGERCQKHALTGATKCAFHNAGHVGAKSTLTPELADRLVALIKAGNYITVAVRACGISRALLYQWLARGESLAESDAAYAELRERVENAKAEGEARNVASIANAARDNWLAAAWLLERQYPDRWGRASVRMRDEPVEQPIAAPIDPDDPFREVDELADRRRARTG
jgi:hypothetical protein